MNSAMFSADSGYFCRFGRASARIQAEDAEHEKARSYAGLCRAAQIKETKFLGL